MRLKCFLLLTGLGLLFGPAAGLEQLRGQSGKSGEHGAAAHAATDLKARWKQTTGGAAVWRRADLTDPQQQFVFDLVADRVQSTNGEITKEQFLAMAQQPTAGRSGGAARASHDGAEASKSSERRPPAPVVASAGGPGESGPASSAEAEFIRMDVNGDGLLDHDEMDEGLRAERDRWDTNQDGFIDLAEFRAYFKARARQEHAGGRGRPGAVVGGRTDKPARANSAVDLPPNLPDWFRQYDTDGDGQIGLYEWKAAGQPIAQFKAMDNNGDGFLTPDEVLATLPGHAETQLAKEPPANEQKEQSAKVAAETMLRNDMVRQIQFIQLSGKNGGLIIRSAK